MLQKGFNSPEGKSSSLATVSQKGMPGIKLPDLTNENTDCPVKFQF